MILEYKGIPIFYSDQGQGTPIVLLHGFLENSTMWNRLVLEISQAHRTICIDLLGHGQTGCLGYVHTMEMMAECVDAIIKHLKIDKSIFIGHSMGGYVALAYADLFPSKMEGLCLMNSTAKSDNMERQMNRDRAIAAVKQNYKAFISVSVSNLFALKNRERLIDEINMVKQEALKMPLQGIIAALEGMKIRKDRTEILHKSQFKKQMIIGVNDPVLDPNLLLLQVKGTDVEIVEFPDGHMSYIENKKDLTYKILHFIEN